MHSSTLINFSLSSEEMNIIPTENWLKDNEMNEYVNDYNPVINFRVISLAALRHEVQNHRPVIRQ